MLVDSFPDVLNVEFTAGMEDVLDRIEEGKENWKAALHRFHEPFAEVVTGGARPVRLLRGGELSRPAEEIAPGFIAAMLHGEAPAPEHRRAALARWLTSPQHPLTARVIVNRVWQHHFGAGLVATPSDFGRNGRRPTRVVEGQAEGDIHFSQLALGCAGHVGAGSGGR